MNLTHINIPLFRNIDKKQVDEILAAGNLRPLAKDGLLFSQGEPFVYFYIVVTGAIKKFRRTAQGKEATLEVMSTGNVIGASYILETSRYQWNAAALEDSMLLEYPAAWIRERIRKQPLLALNLLSELSHTTQLAYLDAEHKKTFTATQRLACFLLRFSTAHGLNRECFELPYGKKVIASKLGMEPETFSRAVKRLNEWGISIANKKVTIKDNDAAEHETCKECSIFEECRTHLTYSGLDKTMNLKKA